MSEGDVKWRNEQTNIGHPYLRGSRQDVPSVSDVLENVSGYAIVL